VDSVVAESSSAGLAATEEDAEEEGSVDTELEELVEATMAAAASTEIESSLLLGVAPRRKGFDKESAKRLAAFSKIMGDKLCPTCKRPVSAIDLGTIIYYHNLMHSIKNCIEADFGKCSLCRQAELVEKNIHMSERYKIRQRVETAPEVNRAAAEATAGEALPGPEKAQIPAPPSAASVSVPRARSKGKQQMAPPMMPSPDLHMPPPDYDLNEFTDETSAISALRMDVRRFTGIPYDMCFELIM